MAQGVQGESKGTNKIHFVYRHEIPKHKKVTYVRIVVDIKEHKDEIFGTRITFGGDRLLYEFDLYTLTVDIYMANILFDSVVSTRGARFATADIRKFYLATPFDDPKYMRIPAHLLPEKIMQEYSLKDKIFDGFVYVKITNGIYGLKQAITLVNKQLQSRLAKDRYYQSKHTLGLWFHKTRKIAFSLCVDDFGVKYTKKEDSEHLLKALRKWYKIKVDWTGENYCGLTLKWNYERGYINLSIPGYIVKILKTFAHPPPNKPVHSPSPYTAPLYKSRPQLVEVDNELDLEAKEIKRLQRIVRSLLFYACAVENTLLHVLSEITSQQAKPTKRTRGLCWHLLDYVATHPNPTLQFWRSGMLLWVISDAAYLVAPQAQSGAGVHFFLGKITKERGPRQTIMACFITGVK